MSMPTVHQMIFLWPFCLTQTTMNKIRSPCIRITTTVTDVNCTNKILLFGHKVPICKKCRHKGHLNAWIKDIAYNSLIDSLAA